MVANASGSVVLFFVGTDCVYVGAITIYHAFEAAAGQAILSRANGIGHRRTWNFADQHRCISAQQIREAPSLSVFIRVHLWLIPQSVVKFLLVWIEFFYRDLRFFGRHGCHAAENELGQKFIVDITLECDLRAAGQSDSLDDTLNYVAIYEAATNIVEGEPAKLLEHIAEKIASAALEH